MQSKKIFAGDRLRRLRERLGMKQSTVAQSLMISASYYNQLEKDQRPITRDILMKLSAAFGMTETYFVDTDDVRRSSNIREALADPIFRGRSVSPGTIQSSVRVAPEFSDAFMALYRAYSIQRDENQSTGHSSTTTSYGTTSIFPYDEVRDWIQSKRNYFDALDKTAERLFEASKFDRTNLISGLKRYLLDRHEIVTDHTPGILAQGMFWRLNKAAKRLYIAQEASIESETFWLAHVIGQIEYKNLIEREIRAAKLSSEEANGLARIGMANYFAGALMMPYRQFLESAQRARYDLQLLQRQYGSGFEQVCHRLSTLQRPDLPGIPFYFAKIDIAGNILKRSSASRFQFAQFGSPCPLWNVFKAFAHPGEILVQFASSADAITYLNIARTVGRSGESYLSRPRSVAVVLGCEARHASQIVYSAGLDINNPDVADPIGPGCRACERTSCRHRSVPPVGHALDVGTAERGVVPYRILLEGEL